MQVFNNKSIIVLVLMLFCQLSESIFFPIVKDFKHKLFGPYGREADYNNNYNPYGNYYRNSPTTQYHPNSGGSSSSKRGGRTYSDIASVINGNPYAFVGSRPFPSQPFWPQG
uniref:Uncharacterized protein n=1 Tax=Glossina brevipalpis TaxID=37001 RepID=A0A1A9W6G8_9MUSC